MATKKLENTKVCTNCGVSQKGGQLFLQVRSGELSGDDFKTLKKLFPRLKGKITKRTEAIYLCGEDAATFNRETDSKYGYRSHTTLDEVDNIPTRHVPLSDVEPYLGKMEDIELADKFGYSRERIRQFRESLGIPKFERFPLPTDAAKLEQVKHDLRNMFNAEVMEKYQITETGIEKWRTELQIPARRSGYELPKMPIPSDFEKLYDTMTNDDLAEHYKVSVMTVYRWAKSFKPPLKKAYNEKIDPPTGFAKEYYNDTNLNLAKKYDVSLAMITKWAKRLGLELKRPVEEVPQPKKVSKPTVIRRRAN